MDIHAAFTSPISYTLRPRVHEADVGEYRGCVEVIGRGSHRTFSFTRFCHLARPSRECAEDDAMRLAQRLCETECGDGKSWILPEQLNQVGEEGQLESVPSSLLHPVPSTLPARRGKRHLRVAA